MSRPVLLVEIGASDLPAVTPAAPLAASWMPIIYVAPQPAEPMHLLAAPAVDGVLLTWDAVDGAQWVVWSAPAAEGPWTEVYRGPDARYFHSTPVDGDSVYFRVAASINGRVGVAGYAYAAPKLPASEEAIAELREDLDALALKQFQDAAKEAQDRADGIAAEAQQRQTEISAERAAREAAVAAERARIDAIDDDEVISPVEKPQLRIDFSALLDERAGINAEADLSEVVDEKAAYNEALDRLITYMDTLTTPTRWDDTSGYTNLT